MRDIAAELNFPVTAFILQTSPGQYSIRYFTPVVEIPACGHATLAAAKAAMLEGNHDIVNFHTTEGIVLKAISEGPSIMMTYPKYTMQPMEVSRETLDSLQLKEYKTAGYCSELECLFIETDANTLRTIKPDYKKLVQSNSEIIEVVVTSVADTNGHDYLLRSFCPWIGIDEDPVTGSVHAVLSGFWKERLHKNVLKARQASERGGEVIVKAYDDKTEIGGIASIVQKAQMEF